MPIPTHRRCCYTSGMSNTISAADFGLLIQDRKAPHVVDVRTPAEFAAVHVESARLCPLDDLDPTKVAADLNLQADHTIYILCKSGMRAGKAAEKFRAKGIANVCVVEGGTDACVAAGLAVSGGGKPGIPLDRQVRIAIGSVVLGAWVLSHWIPLVRFLIPFAGAGLIFSGVTGFCGLAMILAKAPWNSAQVAACKRVG